VRIWYQSFTDPDEARGYHERLVKYAAGAARSGTRIEVFGMRPPSRRHRVTELSCALEAVRNAIRAEEEGYDAFILGHFQDSGLWEARSAAAIPVIGIGESSMLHACTLGTTIGLITIHPTFIPYHHEQIRRYGLQDRVVAVRAVDTAAGQYVRAFSDPGEAKALAGRYAQEIEVLVKQGIEVVLPAGGLPALLFGAEVKASAAPALLLDSIAVAIKAAEMAVDLKRFNGTSASRALAFAPPSEAALEAIGVRRGKNGRS
jgi:Asp/Glu/hydantoin racemase